jgi:hypothetical protein
MFMETLSNWRIVEYIGGFPAKVEGITVRGAREDVLSRYHGVDHTMLPIHSFRRDEAGRLICETTDMGKNGTGIANISCTILVSPHPEFLKMIEKEGLTLDQALEDVSKLSRYLMKK